MKRWQKIVAIAVAVLAVALIVLALAVDSIATSKAREQAAKLSQEWGRKVTIGSVSTKVLTGLGVRVSDVSIGPAEGEELPLLEIKRVEVKLALIRAALSRGKDVDVHSAEIAGLTVNLIRLADGTTNLERLQQKLAAQAKPPEDPAAPKPETDLSFLRVDHAAILDGRIVFLDKETKGAKELAIRKLDVRVDDLRVGQPLNVVMTAAVLGEQPNFELRMKALPLPKSMTPTPTQLTLKIEPIDLAPLGPFAGKDLGLEGGKLDADFDMQLGAAAPGGSGPSSVKGGIHALGLQFAGAEGGKAIDLVLDTNITGDAAKGDVQIQKLRFDFGPAGIVGTGSASGLNTSAPRIEGLELTSHDLDPARLAAYYPPLRKLLKGQIAGPVGLKIKGGGTKEAQTLQLGVDLTYARLTIPATLSKGTGGPMTLLANVRGAAAANGPLRFDLRADLSGVDLRPGESINKAPGQRLELSAQGTRSAEEVSVEDLKLHVLDDELEGHAKISTPPGKKIFELALQSSHLDLDKLLLPTKPKQEKPPLDPKLFAGVKGHATVRIDSLTSSKQQLTNVVADISMDEDAVKLNKADLVAFGGTVSATGTEVRLAHPSEPFHVVTHFKDVELANAAALFSDHKLLTGKFNGDVDLKGGGQTKAELVKTLAGALEGHLVDGSFLGKDLIASIVGPLSKALPSGLAGKTADGGSTSLGHDLPLGLTFANGVAQLKRPISVTRPEAQISLSGGINLDGNLDLPGTISLSPQTIAQLTGGRAKVQQAIPFQVHVTGPAWNPTISNLDLKPAIAQIVKEAGASLVGRALGVDNVNQAVDQKKKQVEDAARAKQDEVTKQAQEAAQKQQQKLEDEAKNRLKGIFGR